MVGHRVKRTGCCRNEQLSRALKELQEMGYVTELWFNKAGVPTLRWVMKGEQWRVTASHYNHIRDQFEDLRRHVSMWLTVVKNDNGNPHNYAVREV